MENSEINFRPTQDGQPAAPPPLRKPLHLFTLAESQKGADEYFLGDDRAEFKKRRVNGRLTFFCIRARCRTILGKGYSYGEALVDAFSTAEKKKAAQQYRDRQEADSQEAVQTQHDKAHPVKAAARRLRNLFRS